MELVPGEPLSALLERSGRLPLDTALDIVEQTATALHAAHAAGVVHRDVKPGNLLLSESDGTIKLADFGIAKTAAEEPSITQVGSVRRVQLCPPFGVRHRPSVVPA